jgi:nitrogen regulatory protein PII
MKKLQIIIDPAQLDSVVGLLNQNTVHHFTVTELKEFGVGAGSTAFRGQAQSTRFKTRVMLEAMLPAETVQAVVAALRQSVRASAQPEVYVSPVESVDMSYQSKSSLLAEAGVN